MLTHPRRRLGGDDGMSLVEMLIALFILAIALMALASGILASLTSIGNDERRVRATQLANQTVEDLRGMAWDDVGFYSDDPGYTATVDGQETVTLGSSRAGAPGPLPGPQSVTRDGIPFTVTTNITWKDDDTEVGPGGYEPTQLKAFHVVVAWSDRDTPRSFESRGTRSPSVDEVPLVEAPTPAPSGFVITAYDISPSTVTISSSDNTEQSILVTVETSLPATSVVLDPAPLAALSMQEVAGSEGLQWSHEIAQGNGDFPPGDRSFTVTATGLEGSDVKTQVVTFEQVDDSLGEVIVQTPELVPSPPICTTNDGWTTAPVTLTFEVHGLVSASDTASITWTDKNDGAQATIMDATADGYRFQATIPQETRFNKSTTTVTITATRVATNTTASQPFVYQVATC